MRKTILLFFPLFFTGPFSWAGTSLQTRLQSFADKQAWADLDVSIDQSKMRLDFQGPWSHGSLIYARETSLVTVVDKIHETNLTITPADQSALKMLGGLALGLAESQADKGNWNGRKTFAIIRKNIRAFFNGTPLLKAKQVRMVGMECGRYVTELEGEKAREVWSTDPEKTSLSGEDYNTLRSLAHLALDLAGDELVQLGADPAAFQRLFSKPELPVVLVLFEKGKPSCRFEIKKLFSQSFTPEAFDPPASYRAIGLLDILKKQQASQP